MEKLHEVREFRHELLCKAKAWYDEDCSKVDTKEMGEIIDICKDLAEIEKECWEARYYMLVCDAMESGGESDIHSTRHHTPHGMMGPMHSGEVHDPDYGMPFNQYRNARRHYTETHQEQDKSEMDRHASDHLSQTLMTVREIWKNADPMMRKKMKSDLTGLVGEMTI